MKNIAIILVFMLILSGCTTHRQSLKEKVDALDSSSNEDQDETSDEIVTEQTTKNVKPILEGLSAEEMMQKMTLEEKVAQLFIVDFYTYNKLLQVTEMTMQLEERISSFPVGGVIFFNDNIVNRNQVTNLIESVQSKTQIPLFVSIDEEGGLVSRLQKNPEIGMTVTPEASVIGDTLLPQNAYRVGKILGEELNALGFNMDFAPVADVNTNPDNPVIGNRSFSSEQKVVADMVAEEIRGLQEQKVAAVVKHFPGHGDTSTDTHTGAVYVEHDRSRLDKIELVPFVKAIEEGAMAIMVAHIALPNVTDTDDPASLSFEIITTLLREELQYKGVVITDALNMGAVADSYTSDQSCVKALQAGIDILLMPEDFELGYNGVLNAVKDGTLTEERINESLLRILNLKIALGLMDHATKNPLTVIGSQEHKDTVKAITQ
ncbi:MAG: glycoside hydrolase family 3 [Vallitaleaceae bacterium]|nr:glycoside hydrolase family 3 [Vallitaleaceae bacterium]